VPRFHDFVVTAITGEPVSLSIYADTACLVVNVASA
jgi:glutathione peroxidase-family protein